MTTKTKKPAAQKLDAPKVLGAKSVKVETNAKGEIRKVEMRSATGQERGKASRAAVAEQHDKVAKVATVGKQPAAKETKPAAPGALARGTMKAAGKKPEGEPRNAAAPDDARIVATFTTPPGRPGSVVYRTRALFLTCKTVGAFREAARAADLDLGYLRTDERRGLIKLLPAAPAKESKPKK